MDTLAGTSTGVLSQRQTLCSIYERSWLQRIVTRLSLERELELAFLPRIVRFGLWFECWLYYFIWLQVFVAPTDRAQGSNHILSRQFRETILLSSNVLVWIRGTSRKDQSLVLCIRLVYKSVLWGIVVLACVAGGIVRARKVLAW